MKSMHELFDGSDAHNLDIVDRLRSVGGYFDEAAKKFVSCGEAADEIERLRNLLREASGPMSYGHWHNDFRDEVERALGDY